MTSKIKYKLLSLIAVASLFITFTPTERVYACSCAYDPNLTPQEQLMQNYEREHNELVFTGTVVQLVAPDPNSIVQSSADPIYVTFLVNQVFKGEVAQEFTLTTPMSGASCGYDFVKGNDYLVFAGDDFRDGSWNSGLCSGNQVNPSAELLSIFNNASTPSDSGERGERVPGGTLIEQTIGKSGNLLWWLIPVAVISTVGGVTLWRKKKSSTLLLLLFLVGIFAACSSASDDDLTHAADPAVAELINHSWILVAAGGEADDMFLPEQPAELTFTDRPEPNGEPGLVYTGFTGCNQLFGNYQLRDEQITMGVGQTEVGCEADLMSFEQFMIDTLNNKPLYSLSSEGNDRFLSLQVDGDESRRIFFGHCYGTTKRDT